MKALFVATLIALMTVSAFAQGMGGGTSGGRHRHEQGQKKEGKKKVDDRNYEVPARSIARPKVRPVAQYAHGRTWQGRQDPN